MLKYTDYEREVAIEFAQDLVNCGIDYYLSPSYDNEVFELRQKFYDNLRNLPYDTTIASGSTRSVFMRDDCELDNWVLKVDHEFNSMNYCQAEADYFQEAVAEGLDYGFAATYYLTTLNGIKFYIQERLICDEAVSTEKLREYIIEECGVIQEDDESDEDYESRIWDYQDSWLEWEDVLVCLIGDGDIEEFVYNRGINDLHEGNFGLTHQGYFKILDYCGYHE